MERVFQLHFMLDTNKIYSCRSKMQFIANRKIGYTLVPAMLNIQSDLMAREIRETPIPKEWGEPIK